MPSQQPPKPDDAGPARIEYNGAILVCDEPVKDVGTLWIGPPIDHQFAIRNEGDSIGWIQVTYSMGGVHLPCIGHIEPGETIRIPIHLRSERFRSRFEKMISVRLISEDAERLEDPWCIRKPIDAACEAEP